MAAPDHLPARIRTDASNAFAHHTMSVRVPAILHTVLARNPDYSASVGARISALQGALRAGAPLPPPEPGAPLHESWRAALARRSGEGWLSTDWFGAENYAYWLLAGATDFWRDGRDPFLPIKRDEYASAAHRAAFDAALALDAGSFEGLVALLGASLFGNRIDLSFAASLERGTLVADGDLLVDARAAAAERLLEGSGGVHLVIDNAGTELSVDLVLASRLLEQLGLDVTLHLKRHPAFVSDAIAADVLWFLGSDADGAARWDAEPPLARACRATLRAALASGRLRLESHGFWNGPESLWDLPSDLERELRGARLVVLKGDAHYRRAVGDALWPPETAFAEVTAYFPAPLLALRTLKSDAIVDLPPGRAAELDGSDARWRVNGKRGVASLGGRW